MKKSFSARAGEFVKNKYPVLLIIGSIIGLLFFWVSYKPAPEKIAPLEVKREEVTRYFRVLDGKEVSSPDLVNPRVIAAVVENAADAWPLTGLDQAPIVYEFLAEGRIPRLLTLFTQDDAFIKLGPIRSARLYFLEALKPFDAIFMHVGGSPESLKKIKEYQIKDYDQFFWGDYYWREKTRYAPHNTFVSSEKVDELIEDWHIASVEYKGWNFKDSKKFTEEELTAQEKDEVIVNYTNNTYQAKYIFSPERNQYQRFQAKEEMLMSDGAQIWTDNLIVEEHPHQVLDSIGRRKIEMIGEGKAWVFRDGEKIETTWKKDDINSITRYFESDPNFYLDEGTEIELNRGKTWINIVEGGTFE